MGLEMWCYEGSWKVESGTKDHSTTFPFSQKCQGEVPPIATR